MITIGYVSGGLTVLIILCFLMYRIGYNAGFIQATIEVRERLRKERATS